MNEIVIGNTNVSIKEYKGQRVVTFKDIDTVHGRPDGTARRNFNRNREHFIEGEDFFVRNSYEAKKEYNATAPNGLILLTESGYLMLAKSFTDKVAWDVQRALVKSYFRAKQEHTPEYEQLKLEDKPYEYVDKFYKGMPVLTCKDIEHFSGIHRSTIAEVLRSHCENGKDYILLSGEDMRVFKKENANYPVNVPNLYIVLKSGFDKVAKHFNIKCESVPKVMIEEKCSNTRGVANESTCRLMSYIRREIKGVEALTYLLESNMDLDDFMSLKRILENKLKAIGGWQIDTSGIKLEVHSPSASEMNAIHNGTRGLRYI